MTAAFEKDRADRSRMMQRFALQRDAGLEDMGESVRQRFAKVTADLVREREAGRPDAELRARLVAGVLMTTKGVANDYWLETGAKGDPGECFSGCLELLTDLFSSPHRVDATSLTSASPAMYRRRLSMNRSVVRPGS